MTMRPIQLLALSLFAVALAAPASAEPPAERSGSRPETEYTLGPEDVIEVFVWKEPELSTVVTVRPDGRITLPLAGELDAAGKTPKQLQAEVTERLETYLEVPVVTVSVQAINSRQISVLGEVRRPGRYRLAQRTTVLDAIALGGGFTEFAKRSNVVVLRKTRNGVQRIPVNVKRTLSRGSAPLYLEPGDTIYVD